MAVFVQLFLVIAIRYFSIFHSHIIMEMNEKELIRKSRGFLIIVSLASLFFEILSDGLMHRGPLYKFLVSGDFNQDDEGPAKLLIFRSVIFIDLLCMISLQLKVEFDEYQHSQRRGDA